MSWIERTGCSHLFVHSDARDASATSALASKPAVCVVRREAARLTSVLSIERLGMGPMPTDSPFLFAVHHLDRVREVEAERLAAEKAAASKRAAAAERTAAQSRAALAQRVELVQPLGLGAQLELERHAAARAAPPAAAVASAVREARVLLVADALTFPIFRDPAQQRVGRVRRRIVRAGVDVESAAMLRRRATAEHEAWPFVDDLEIDVIAR